MTYNPVVAAETWLFETLSNAPIEGVSGVYSDVAPEGTTDKDDMWIVFEEFAPPADVSEVAAQTIWTDFIYIVRAVARGRSIVALGDIAAEIDARLHRQDGVVTGAVIVSSTRQRPDRESWTSMGIEYRSLGAIYNLIVQPA